MFSRASRVLSNEASFASYTKDAQPLTAAIEYQYEPIAAQAMQIVSQYGSYEILETKLQQGAGFTFSSQNSSLRLNAGNLTLLLRPGDGFLFLL